MKKRATRPKFQSLFGEEWRKVDFGVGYEVSNFGRVRSWIAGKLRRTMNQPKLRKLVPNKDSYLTVMLMVDGVRKLAYVHLLVLEAFVGPRPEGLVARHLDGKNQNNLPSNLVWGTQVENVEDQKRHGTHAGGYRMSTSKLSREQVALIRSGKFSGKELADLFGVSQATVSQAKNRITYVCP